MDRTALVNKALAQVLKGAYTTEGFTLPTLEAATDPKIPWRTLQRIMAGDAPVTMGQLENIARAINRDAQELFEDALQKADRDEMSPVPSTTASLDQKRKQREAAMMPDGELDEVRKHAAKRKGSDPELGGDEPTSP